MGVLYKMTESAECTYLILDALDECSDIEKFMARIEEIQGWSCQQLHLFLMSRRRNDIEEMIEFMTKPDERIYIQSALVDADISTYMQ